MDGVNINGLMANQEEWPALPSQMVKFVVRHTAYRKKFI